jgi:hypothetical protein
MLSNFEAWKVDQVRRLKMLGGRIMPIASQISSNQTGTKYSQYFKILRNVKTEVSTTHTIKYFSI